MIKVNSFNEFYIKSMCSFIKSIVHITEIIHTTNFNINERDSKWAKSVDERVLLLNSVNRWLCVFMELLHDNSIATYTSYTFF